MAYQNQKAVYEQEYEEYLAGVRKKRKEGGLGATAPNLASARTTDQLPQGTGGGLGTSHPNPGASNPHEGARS